MLGLLLAPVTWLSATGSSFLRVFAAIFAAEYVLTGLGYILAAVFGNWFLNENVTPIHWLGTVLVFVGTGLVGMTAQKTHPEQESE